MFVKYVMQVRSGITTLQTFGHDSELFDAYMHLELCIEWAVIITKFSKNYAFFNQYEYYMYLHIYIYTA